MLAVSLRSQRNSSCATAVVTGAPRSRQSGKSSVERGRLEDGAGEDVGADLGALLDDADGDLAAGRGGKLEQAAGGGETAGPGAHDHHVKLHAFPFGHAAGSLPCRPRKPVDWAPQ